MKSELNDLVCVGRLPVGTMVNGPQIGMGWPVIELNLGKWEMQISLKLCIKTSRQVERRKN